jgi:asparagine synthase (glutamine-hydrolysing)
VKAELSDFDGQAELRSRLPRDYETWDHFSQAQFLEASMLLPGYILSSQGDRMAMANGVEGRYPFLDHRVVEFASRLPARAKMRVLQEKALLKRAFRDAIPEPVRRRTKQPYRAPEAQNFVSQSTGGAQHDYVDELLSERTVRDFGLFSAPATERLLRKARAGQAMSIKDNMALTAILSTHLLVTQFIRNFN